MKARISASGKFGKGGTELFLELRPEEDMTCNALEAILQDLGYVTGRSAQGDIMQGDVIVFPGGERKKRS